VTQNADGRIEVFYIGADDAVIYHHWQLTPNGYWIGEYFLGQRLQVKRNNLR
jgi:hypothetical protein